MHCFNDKFLGPGIFRASSLDQPIVNVSGMSMKILSFRPFLISSLLETTGGNGIILSPAVLSSRWKLTRKGVSNSVSCDNAAYSDVQSHCEDTNSMLLELPEECVFHVNAGSDDINTPPVYDAFKLDDIWETLNKEGIALVHCPWRDLHPGVAGVDYETGNGRVERSIIDSERINSLSEPLAG